MLAHQTASHHNTIPCHISKYILLKCFFGVSMKCNEFCSANEHPSKLGEKLFEIHSAAAIFAEHLAPTQYTRFCRIFFVRFNQIDGM